MRGPTDSKAIEFGRRGRSKAPPPAHPATSMARLKQFGLRWWGNPSPKSKRDPRGLGFKRSRLDT